MRSEVTFVVPCYNYGRYVVQALESLLAQTVRELEIIVVDDASTDNTPEVLTRYQAHPQIKLLRHERNLGHIATYNEALALARGSYVAIMSADDYCLEHDAVARQLALFQAHPSIGMVYSAYRMVAGDKLLSTEAVFPHQGFRHGLDEFHSLIWGNYILHSGTLLRREVQEELGPYDAGLPQSADWDQWLRTCARHDVGYIPEPLYAYRIHLSNMQAKGIPPEQQLVQNVRTLERGFAALPENAPVGIIQCKAAAMNHALLQTAWFDLFHGRRMRVLRGLSCALRHQAALWRGRELWSFMARFALMTVVGGRAYRRSMEQLQRVRTERLQSDCH